jgi:predicted Rossmann fold flavoprotein
MDETEVAVVGAGAAGLMAAIQAGRHGRRVVALDGARRLGAKILVAGGGRCNVTHDRVDESAFAGSSPAAIRKVLRRFDVPQLVSFFADLGVELKREETGKLFPVGDRARTVLDALLRAARDAGAELRHPFRVATVVRSGAGFLLAGPAGTLRAARVVLTPGGRSLPKSGSDGHGYEIARSLGHSLTRVFPGLVPLTLPQGHVLRALSGLSAPARVELRSGSRRRLAAFSDALLCTHFGISGPAVLDISRYWIAAGQDDPGAHLVVDWLPDLPASALDARLREPGPRSIGARLAESLPERLARALCLEADVDPATPAHRLTRDARRALVRNAKEMPLPLTGDRGYDFAEVTAGCVPLSELRLETLESRLCPGLYLAGEICDVDGRIGGYNFQWAWASGFVAGVTAGGPRRSIPTSPSPSTRTGRRRRTGRIDVPRLAPQRLQPLP